MSRRTAIKSMVVSGVTLLGVGATGMSVAQEDASESDAPVEQEATVTFTDQTTDGTSVIAESATLPDGGFVTIHDEALLTNDDPVGSVIGVSEFHGAGDHADIEIPLFGEIQGTEFETSTLRENQTLIAMPHKDTNSSEEYEFVATNGQEDGPYTVNGQAVIADGCVQIC